MKKPRYLVWVISLMAVVYGVLPAEPIKQWDDSLGDGYIYGLYQVSTGGDFVIEKHSLKSDLLNQAPGWLEANLSGNAPTYGFLEGDNQMMEFKFIFKGRMVGAKDDGLGQKVYQFEIDEAYLTQYVPRFRGFTLAKMGLYALSVIVFFAASLVVLVGLIKRRSGPRAGRQTLTQG